MLALINRFRRYRRGWPRGVRPMFPWVREMAEADPEWWQAHAGDPPAAAVRTFLERNPTHPFAAEPYFREVLA